MFLLRSLFISRDFTRIAADMWPETTPRQNQRGG
jgi:hypothetical protein